MSETTPANPRSWTHHRARIGYLVRFDPDNRTALDAEREALRRTKIADDLRRAVIDIPVEQRTELALDLLRVVLPSRGEA